MKINILGTEYTVEERNSETDKKLAEADGYSDHTSKECIVDEMKKSNERTLKNIELYKKSVTRHEMNPGSMFAVGRIMKRWWTGLLFSFQSCMKPFCRLIVFS